jgi:hypothetical protein
VPKTDTRETENLDKAVSFDQKDASTNSLQLSRHVSTKWLTVASPYIPDVVVPAPHLGLSRSKVTICLDWLRGLGDGLGHAMGLYMNPEEETVTL